MSRGEGDKEKHRLLNAARANYEAQFTTPKQVRATTLPYPSIGSVPSPPVGLPLTHADLDKKKKKLAAAKCPRPEQGYGPGEDSCRLAQDP